MEAQLPQAAQLAELAACVRNIADDLVAGNGGFPIRLRQRIADILTPLDSDGTPSHPWQDLYSRLVRTKSPNKAEDDLRNALAPTLSALGNVHRHPRPEHASRLIHAADRLERIAAKWETPRKSRLWHRPITRRESEEYAQRQAPLRIERAVRELRTTLRKASAATVNQNSLPRKKGGDAVAPHPKANRSAILDRDDVHILATLNKAKTTMTQFELIDAMKPLSLSRGTIGDRLKRLREIGFIYRPNCPTRNDAITDRGREALEALQSSTTD